MANKKISKKSKRRLALFAPLSLLAIGIFIFTLISYTYTIVSLTKEERALKEKLTALELEEKDLNTEILKLKDPEYIAKYAREKYYYSKNGEYVIKIEEKENDNENTQEEKDYTNYIIYGGCLILFIIFIFILKRKKSK